MAKNELRLIITADGKRALDTIDATERNIKSLGSQTLKLEQDLKSGIERSAGMADAFRQMNDVVNRYAISMHELNPAISQNEAALKAWKDMMESVITKGGAFGSETLEYIKMQYASVNAEIEKLNISQNENIKALEQSDTTITNTALSFSKYSKEVESANKVSAYFTKMLKTIPNVIGFRIVMNLIKNIANIKNILSESAKAAAEAEQVFSKLNTVFGETSGAMNEVLDLSSKIGVASSTAASALSTVGDLLQAQGQTTVESLQTASKWVSQFQDIIAFKDINMSLEEFAQNFMSGAAGNLRNFRTFGSIVRESAVNAELAKKGLDKLTGSELELAKMTTRAEMALEQQKNAIGATQREWDTMLSVNRRYDEAVKAMKESFGDWTNNIIKPIKKWWTEILEEINKANNAQEQFISGKKNINVYDLSDNIDFSKFYEKISSAVSTGLYDSDSGMKYALIETESAILKFGASAEDIQKVILRLYDVFDDNDIFASGEKFSDFVDRLQKSIQKISKDREYENQIESWNSGLKNLAENADAFIESLAELNGVTGVSSDFVNTLTGNISSEKIAERKWNEIYSSIQENIGKAIESIKDTTIDGYISITESLFGDDSVQNAYTSWLGEVESMYTILYNRMIKYGDVTQQQLDEVYSKWKDIKKEAEKYSKLQSAFETGATNGSYSDSIRLALKAQKNQEVIDKSPNYYPEGFAKAYAEIQLYYEDLYALGNLSIEEQNKLSKKREEEKVQLKEYLTLLEKENAAKEKATQLEELVSGTADYQKQFEQLRMSDFEKTIDDLNRMLEGVTDKDIISAINAQIEAFTKLTEATNEYNAEQEMKKKWEDLGTQASDSLGEFGTLISSFGSGGMPDLLSNLIQIVAQTEAFTRLSSILTDSILPVLNAFLEPIIPLIDQLSSIISNLAQSVLIPFFPILQSISAAIAGLFGIVDATFSAIVSSIKLTMGWALGWIEDAVNTVVGWFGGGKVDWGFIDWRNENPGQVFKDKINKTNDTIEKILGYSMEIADNTSDKDFDTYKKLLLAKEIDQKTYNKWTGMDRYTTQSLANGVSYTTGNRSYVNVNNLTVQVPEGMTLAEFLKGIDDYNNGHGLYSVNTLVS
jgi:hypothetical protein